MTEIQSEAIPIPVLAGFGCPRWYAVQTRSRFEKAVRAELDAQGFENYLATFEELQQWKDRKKMVELPLFSGYVFARFENSDATRLRVLRTHGVVRILGSNGAIEAIPDREIDSVRQVLLSGNRCFPHPFVREGSWVRV